MLRFDRRDAACHASIVYFQTTLVSEYAGTRTAPSAATDWPTGVTLAEVAVRSGVARVSTSAGACSGTDFGSRNTRLPVEQFWMMSVTRFGLRNRAASTAK